ncbi:MAG TPA: 3',5'-nucleoside bisphosphate phosphatase [Burkholderiales bacterium]|nr:3',5'-nucleoside bisphosphate phosphatase [Burkholderiales bacterium]
MPGIDLHCHSTVSDGLLAPAEVVRRAAAQGVTMLALTDHDDLDGLAAAGAAATELGMAFVPGVEVSVTWRNHTIHVVGLGIDAGNADLCGGLEALRRGREERARRMGESLARVGIPGAFEGALRLAGSPRLLSRTHFARFLVEQGRARDVKRVFRRFLVKGRPGYVSHQWAGLDEAVNWIRGAEGIAVLAHPGRYEIGATNLAALLGEFKDLGGAAIEVVSGSHAPRQSAEFARHAATFGLLASSGSDFHGPGESYFELGRMPELPPGCVPVWGPAGFAH